MAGGTVVVGSPAAIVARWLGDGSLDRRRLRERVFADGETVSPAGLVKKGLIRKDTSLIKILATGELTKKLTVEAHKFSGSARLKIEATGGRCEVMTS